MPLLKGKENVGHNIEEMERVGHPHKQAVAAALRTARDKTAEASAIHTRQTIAAGRDNQPALVTQPSAGVPQLPKWKGRVV